MNANTAAEVTAQRANTIAFMTPAEADIYLAECKAWDAQMAELAEVTAPKVNTITVTVPARKLFAPATVTEVRFENVTAADLKTNDKVVYTGKNGESWMVDVTNSSFLNNAADGKLIDEDLYYTYVGQRRIEAGSKGYRRVIG